MPCTGGLDQVRRDRERERRWKAEEAKREMKRDEREGEWREKSASATLSYANSETPGGKGRMQISPVAI